MSLAKYATVGEALVALKLIRTLVKRGYAVSIWNGGEEAEIENSTDVNALLSEMAATGEEEITANNIWFSLVYGNADDGSELISDYYANRECEAIVQEINA